LGILERTEERLARVRIERPEPLRLPFREPKPRHLQKLASNNLEQADQINLVAGAPHVNDYAHDGTSENLKNGFNRAIRVPWPNPLLHKIKAEIAAAVRGIIHSCGEI
jgi:hypothetical protein